MDDDNRLRMLKGSEARLLETLSAIERRVAELEAEASRLKKLRGELEARARDDERHNERPWSHEFFKLNFIVRRECSRILRRLREAQVAEVKVVVVRVPVIVRPEPSMN